jgi:hypothetical protein
MPGEGRISAGAIETSKTKFAFAKLGFGVGAGVVVTRGASGLPTGRRRRRTFRLDPSHASRNGRMVSLIPDMMPRISGEAIAMRVIVVENRRKRLGGIEML